MISPTARSLNFLRKAGYVAGIVEKRNQYAGPPHMKCKACGKNRVGLTQDLFGWCDIVAVHPDVPGTLYVQTTSASNHSSRRKKVFASEDARTVLRASNRVWVLTWRKVGRLWEPRIEEIMLGHFPDAEEAPK